MCNSELSHGCVAGLGQNAVVIEHFSNGKKSKLILLNSARLSNFQQENAVNTLKAVSHQKLLISVSC